MQPLRRFKARNHDPLLTPRQAQAERLLARRKAKRLRRIAAGAGAAALLGVSLWAQVSGEFARFAGWAEDATVKAAVDAGLTVESVKVTGRHWTDVADLRHALDIQRGQSLLHLDLKGMLARIEALGWVKSATLYRSLPNRLHVEIEERQPFAIWQYEGNLRIIDHEGTVIVPAKLEQFAGLPLVVGKGAADDAAEVETMLSAEPDLAARVAAAVRVGDRRWNIRFDNGVEARLPEGGATEAWHRLAELDRAHALLERDIVHVDLRLADRLVVRRDAVKFRGKGKDKAI